MAQVNHKQHTIQKEINIEGIGLHTGKPVSLTIKPGLPNSGVIFKRVDLPDKPIIPAHISKVTPPDKRLRRTSIEEKGIEVHTIEHIMAALAGLKIDNVLIEIDGEELPGLDGSILPFIKVLSEGGIKEQNVRPKVISVNSPVWAKEEDAIIFMLPDNNFSISYTLDYDNSYISSQYIKYVGEDSNFIRKIADSRTFCLEEEVEILKKKGLGKGANFNNTVVVGENGLLHHELRSENEFAKHKVLDLIGDLYLLGGLIKGRIVAIKSGHSLNIKFLQEIQRQQEGTERGGVRATGVISKGEKLNIEAIHKVLPHRYPFLLVDKILELEDNYAVGIKNVSINEHFFQGHFPGRPVMPGVLIVEAMAQVAGVLMLSKPENQGKMAYFMSIDKVKFRKAVLPGDQLRLEVEIVKVKSKTGQVHTRALVKDKIVAESDLMFALVK